MVTIPERYTISGLARTVGVPVTTLRYYERIGLLVPDGRSAGNYRLYSDASLHRLRFVRAAQDIGFTLDHVRTLLGSRGDRTVSCNDVQTLIEERLTDIECRLKDLRTVRRVLKTALRKCRESEGGGCCHLIEALEETVRRP